STTTLCFNSLILPITRTVYVFLHLWTCMGIKIFKNN
ncbi:hypothetical protein DBR06_SOUSAS20510027, partial [Sousa chinensis]